MPFKYKPRFGSSAGSRCLNFAGTKYPARGEPFEEPLMALCPKLRGMARPWAYGVNGATYS